MRISLTNLGSYDLFASCASSKRGDYQQRHEQHHARAAACLPSPHNVCKSQKKEQPLSPRLSILKALSSSVPFLTRSYVLCWVPVVM